MKLWDANSMIVFRFCEMEKAKKYLLLCFMIVGLLISCVEEQDFNQFDDLEIIPTVEASIFYLETPESLINLSSGLNFYSQTFNFDAFSEEFFSENVLDGVVTYEVENTTSKQLDITVEFLDEAGNVLDTENFPVNPAPTSILQREIAYGGAGRSIDIIKNTSSIRISGLNLGDSSSVSNLQDPKIILRSSGEFRVSLK